MTTDSYRNFIAIVDSGNILAASQKLMIAQPSLSNQLKNIENKFGVKLINRGSRSIELTPAGEIFYQKAKIICSIEDSAHKEINDCVSGISGTLKISLPPSNPESLMHNLFNKFVALHPDVNFEINEILSDKVADNVRNGISEIGLIRTHIVNHNEFNFYPYENEELMVLISNDHPLSHEKSISLLQLMDQKITAPAGWIFQIKEAFKSMQLTPRIYNITSTRSTAIQWAKDYNCVAMVPCGTRDIEEEKEMQVLKISDYDFSSQRAFITLKNHELSRLAKEFLSYQVQQKSFSH